MMNPASVHRPQGRPEKVTPSAISQAQNALNAELETLVDGCPKCSWNIKKGRRRVCSSHVAHYENIRLRYLAMEAQV